MSGTGECLTLVATAGNTTCAGVCVSTGPCSGSNVPLWTVRGANIVVNASADHSFDGWCLDEATEFLYLQAYRCDPPPGTNQQWAYDPATGALAELWSGTRGCADAVGPGACPPRWPPVVLDYRTLLATNSRNVSAFGAAGRALRQWMMANDPHYPIFHFRPPEGFNNDPNGLVRDPKTKLYHRFYQ